MTITDLSALDACRAIGHCEWCHRSGTELCCSLCAHHIIARGMGNGSRLDHPWNLVCLCTDCHNAHHWGKHPTTQDCLAMVSKRTGKHSAEILDTLWELLRRPKDARV